MRTHVRIEEIGTMLQQKVPIENSRRQRCVNTVEQEKRIDDGEYEQDKSGQRRKEMPEINSKVPAYRQNYGDQWQKQIV